MFASSPKFQLNGMGKHRKSCLKMTKIEPQEDSYQQTGARTTCMRTGVQWLQFKKDVRRSSFENIFQATTRSLIRDWKHHDFLAGNRWLEDEKKCRELKHNVFSKSYNINLCSKVLDASGGLWHSCSTATWTAHFSHQSPQLDFSYFASNSVSSFYAPPGPHQTLTQRDVPCQP